MGDGDDHFFALDEVFHIHFEFRIA